MMCNLRAAVSACVRALLSGSHCISHFSIVLSLLLHLKCGDISFDYFDTKRCRQANEQTVSYDRNTALCMPHL